MPAPSNAARPELRSARPGTRRRAVRDVSAVPRRARIPGPVRPGAARGRYPRGRGDPRRDTRVAARHVLPGRRRPGLAAVRRPRLLLQRRRHGRDVPVRERLLRLPVAVRAHAPVRSRAGGATVAVRRLPEPVHRRPVRGRPQPRARQHERVLARRAAAGLQGGQRAGPDRPGHPRYGRGVQLGRRPVVADGDRAPEGRPAHRRAGVLRLHGQGRGDTGHRLLRSGRVRADRARGLVRGAVLVDGARLGGNGKLRGVPGHPAHRQPGAAEGRRARYTCGTGRKTSTSASYQERELPSAGTGAPTGSPRTS